MAASRTVDVIPAIALPPRRRSHYTYRLPSGTAAPVGALVRVPFGEREVEGIVWSTLRSAGRKRHAQLKFVRDVRREHLVRPKELPYIEAFATASGESVPLLLKALVAVRRVLEHDVSEDLRAGDDTVVEARWTDRLGDIPDSLPDGHVLALVPEEAVAVRVEERLRRAGRVVLRFSQTLRARQRRKVLNHVARGDPAVIVGTHPSLFLPFVALRAIVVVEASFPAHRRWDPHPRYDARVGALLLARLFRARVIFTSTLPSVALTTLVEHGTPSTGSPPSPGCRIVGRTERNGTPLAPESERAIRETLAGGAPVFLFQNVAGAERQYTCRRCGTMLRCEACGRILSRTQRSLVCRSCGQIAGPVRQFCPTCGSPHVRPLRVGTRAVEEMARQAFPGTPVLRLDTESVPRRHGGTLKMEQPQIVIGTERAFAVLPDDVFGMAVVVDADALLARSDVDAAERALQLVARVATVTRGDPSRTVLVQTTMPTFPLFRALAEHTVEQWIREELSDRTRLSFPPSVGLLRCLREFSKEATARQVVAELVAEARRRPALRAGGRVVRVQRGFRGDVLIRGPLDALTGIRENIVRSWDVDPEISFSLLTHSP